jgi:hypothetical protein
VRGFLILTAAVLGIIGVGVTVIAVESPPPFYECPTTSYCLGVAHAFGIRGPVLVPSQAELRAKTGLFVKDRLLVVGGAATPLPSDEEGQPFWALRYDLTDPANQPPTYFYLTDGFTVVEYGVPACHRELQHLGGISTYITPAVAPGGRRFCYLLQVSHGHFSDLEVSGRFGAPSAS